MLRAFDSFTPEELDTNLLVCDDAARQVGLDVRTRRLELSGDPFYPKVNVYYHKTSISFDQLMKTKVWE